MVDSGFQMGRKAVRVYRHALDCFSHFLSPLAAVNSHRRTELRRAFVSDMRSRSAATPAVNHQRTAGGGQE